MYGVIILEDLLCCSCALKKQSSQSRNDLRPVALTSCVENVFEKCVLFHIHKVVAPFPDPSNLHAGPEEWSMKQLCTFSITNMAIKKVQDLVSALKSLTFRGLSIPTSPNYIGWAYGHGYLAFLYNLDT